MYCVSTSYFVDDIFPVFREMKNGKFWETLVCIRLYKQILCWYTYHSYIVLRIRPYIGSDYNKILLICLLCTFVYQRLIDCNASAIKADSPRKTWNPPSLTARNVNHMHKVCIPNRIPRPWNIYDETKGRSRHQNDNERLVTNSEKWNVGTKIKCLNKAYQALRF